MFIPIELIYLYTSFLPLELGGYHTALVVVGTILTLVLYGLFFEQIYFIHVNVNKVFRMHVVWITSVYPVSSLILSS